MLCAQGDDYDDYEYGVYGRSRRPRSSRYASDVYGSESLGGSRQRSHHGELTASDTWPGTAFGERTQWEQIGCYPKDGWGGLWADRGEYL